MTSKRWLHVATVGCAMIVVAMIVTALVIWDKPHFGWLVGTWFLQIITSGVVVGSIVLLVGAWKMRERKSWRGMVLLAWGVVALISPLFGIMFLGPWALLALSLPLIIAILIALYQRESRPSPA